MSFPDFRPQLSQFLPHDKGTEHIVAKRRGVEHPVQECRNNAVGAMNGLNLAPERVQEEFNLDCVGENDRVVVWFERFFDDRGRVIESHGLGVLPNLAALLCKSSPILPLVAQSPHAWMVVAKTKDSAKVGT